ncbi:MAG: hypothetical protein WAM95_09005 [Bacillus sp. (in: firmicutes)]
MEEKVFVGLLSSEEDYASFIRDGFYQILVHLLKKGWQETRFVVLYAKSGVAQYHGVKEYGTISDVTFVEVDQVEYVRFHVEYWMKLPQVIYLVHYGIANYAITTIDTLKEARELPELFMKSKYEMVLWRMLRRVSDRVRVELDQENLDEANQIQSYSIRDIEIELNREQRELVFCKHSERRSISTEVLEKQPSKVFKILLHLME